MFFFYYLCHFTFMSRNDNSACFTSVRTVFFCCCVHYKLFFELISRWKLMLKWKLLIGRKSLELKVINSHLIISHCKPFLTSILIRCFYLETNQCNHSGKTSSHFANKLRSFSAWNQPSILLLLQKKGGENFNKQLTPALLDSERRLAVNIFLNKQIKFPIAEILDHKSMRWKFLYYCTSSLPSKNYSKCRRGTPTFFR
jgi:hypothetical protein